MTSALLDELKSVMWATTLSIRPQPSSAQNQPEIVPEYGYSVARHVLDEMPTRKVRPATAHAAQSVRATWRPFPG
jgi:hypothetical protein